MKKVIIIVTLFLLTLPSFAQKVQTPKNGGYYTTNVSVLENTNSRYKALKPYYSKNDYFTVDNPRFGLGLPWVNALIPGLAQYIMDEPGLGTTYLLLGLGCNTITSVGGVIARKSLTNEKNPEAAYNTGMILVFAGTLGSLAVGILSIINAYDVVKVKSLYIEDVKNYHKGYSFSLQPTMNLAVTSNGYVPAPGMGLSVAF